MNNCAFLGRIVRDAELKYIPGSGTAKLQFTLAVDRDYKKQDGTKETDFINMEIVGKRAESMVSYLTKGKLITATGSLRINNYMTQGGEKRSYTSINIDKIGFVPGGKKEANEDNTNETNFEPSFGLDPQGFQAISDDELPF